MSTDTNDQGRDRAHARAARVVRGGARRDSPARHRRPRRARRQLHPPRDQGAARPRGRWPRPALRRLPAARLARRHGRALAVEDPRQHGDRAQRHARPVRLDERPQALEQGRSSGIRPARATSGATPTTTCTTPTRTSSARTATSATASCACPRTSSGGPTTSATRSTRRCWRRSSSTASRCTTSRSSGSPRGRPR